jgi:hypothetical protein
MRKQIIPMSTHFKWIFIVLGLIGVLSLIAIKADGQTPRETLSLITEEYQIRYQNNDNTWSTWEKHDCNLAIGVFPEHQLVVIDDGETDYFSEKSQSNIYSINTKTINQKWFNGMDYLGQPLVISIIRNKDWAYNVGFKYENKKSENRQLICGKELIYLNCKIYNPQ